MNVVVRADASTRIGSGHVMRCLALAQALDKFGASVSFICRQHEGHLSDLLESRGFSVHRLGPCYRGEMWREDAAAVVPLLDSQEVDWLVVDHYALDAGWESAVRPHVRNILVLDDLANRSHDCDALLDQNLIADASSRYSRMVPPACRLLMGPDFALLQSVYAELHEQARVREGHIRTLCISFGGTDPKNLAGRALEAFVSLARPEVTVDVVTGFGNSHEESIQQLARRHPNVRVHKTLPTLGPLLANADLAIGAGGTTTWERLCVGVPTLVVTTADNQRHVAATLEKSGLIRWLGHEDAVRTDDIAASLSQLLQKGLDKEWSARCLAMVDGIGAERAVAVLAMTNAPCLHARRASIRDEALLLRWVNDPVVREHSFNQKVVSAHEHRAWFRNRLGEPDECQIYIVEAPNGLPVGQVRFDLRAGRWVINYSVDRAFRGRGLGRHVLRAALRRLQTERGAVSAVAKVKPSNYSSRKVFEALGFRLDAVETGGAYSEYTLLPKDFNSSQG